MADLLDDTALIIDAVRTGRAVTQPQLTQLGLGRSVVAQRVGDLLEARILVQDGSAPSTGGRAAKRLRINAAAGLIVGVECGATHMAVALADLAGDLVAETVLDIDIADGPEIVLDRLEGAVAGLLAELRDAPPIWGVALGVPGPVEFSTGRPVAPPIMPGWDAFPVRDRLAAVWGAPVWVDNDVNVIAMGELRTNPAAAAAGDVLCIKIGTGIGAGLISGGRVHRGANGCAGDIGHITVPGSSDIACRCGNTGCLEAVAGGAALARDGQALAASGGSEMLAETLRATGRVTAGDVVAASQRGDAPARALLVHAASVIGGSLATLVSFYNPGLVVLSGAVLAAGDPVVATIRGGVYRRSLPLATRSLRIEPSALGRGAGLVGAVHLALDGIFDPATLARWLPHRTPAGHPEIVTAPLGHVA